MRNIRATATDHRGDRAPGVMAVVTTLELVLALVVCGIAVWFGELNQDEGWYLYAGRLVAEGQRPFVDFASTQGPVMAYVYAAAYPLVAAWGVLGGRLFTAALGLLATLLTAGLALALTARGAADASCNGRAPSASRPAAGALSAVLIAVLLGGSLYHAYFTSIVKTYSLTAVLVVAGFLCLAQVVTACRTVRNALPAFLAGLCFATAAGVRLSSGIVLPVAGLWLLVRAVAARTAACGVAASADAAAAESNDGADAIQASRAAIAALAAFVAGGVLGLMGVFLPILWAAPQALRFGLLDYHAARMVGGPATQLVYKCGFLLRIAGAYFPLIVAGVLVAAVALADRCGRVFHAPDRPRRTPPALEGLLLATFAAITLVHLIAPFPYDDYQVFALPLLAAVIASRLARLIGVQSDRRRAAILLALLLLSGLHAASSPLLQSWLLAPRNRIWWPLRTETSLAVLQRAATLVKTENERASAPSDLLLTQDLYLAVEAGLHVPAGMELGPFCYFPALTDQEAARCHVLNRAGLEAVLGNCPAAVAAFSDYGLAIRAPAVTMLPVDEQAHLWAILRTRYAETTRITQFGQASTTLRVLTAVPAATP